MHILGKNSPEIKTGSICPPHTCMSKNIPVISIWDFLYFLYIKSTKEDKAFYKEGKVLCALQDAIKKYEENKIA